MDNLSNKDFQIPDQLSWSDFRMHKTLDTGISGVLAGGILRGWKSGPRAVLPGALTAGAICTGLQLAYNELGILRLKYISRHANHSHSTPPPTPTVVPMLERILISFGMQPISDEEYLRKLKNTRDKHLKRIEQLEQQLEAEKTTEQKRA